MAQLLVRNIDDDLKALLKERASRDGVSMEEEVRLILRSALQPTPEAQSGLGSRIAALFRGIDLEEDELQRLPRSEVKPMNFDP